MGIIKTLRTSCIIQGMLMFADGGAIANCMGGKNDGCSSVHCCGIACCKKGRPFVPCCTAFGVSLVLGSSLALAAVSSRSAVP